MAIVHVDGGGSHKVMLYALSTCIWCKRTRKLLEDLGIAYDYEYVDLLSGPARAKAVEIVAKWSNSTSFPIMIIDEKHCIIGFDEAKIRESLGK